MGYIQDSLSDGEEVRALFKLHWVAKIWLIIWIVLAIPTFGITLLLALWEWLKLRNIEQGVTNKRVILKRGIISRKTEEMKISFPQQRGKIDERQRRQTDEKKRVLCFGTGSACANPNGAVDCAGVGGRKDAAGGDRRTGGELQGRFAEDLRV